MSAVRSYLPIAALAAAGAGLASVFASGVTLYPATMDLSVSIAPATETVTTIQAAIYPTAGGQAITKSVTASGSPPYTVDVIVDGGNPSVPTDTGFSYRPSITAYLQNPGATTYLRVNQNNPVEVDNTPDDNSVTVPVAFNYPEISWANATITVNGGKIASYQLNASANNSVANESYSSYTNGNGNSQTSVTNRVPIIPSATVYVSGSVTVVSDNGTASQRSLASQTLNLSAGDDNVNWVVDLTNTGVLEGDIDISTTGSTATPTGYYVYYYGTSPATSGISGSIYVNASQTSGTTPDYRAELTQGKYAVYMNAYFSNPNQSSATRRIVVDIGAGTTTHDFTDTYGVGRVSLDVSGHYDISSLRSATSYIFTPDYQASGYTSQSPITGLELTVPVGEWMSYYTSVSTYDQSNPLLPNNNNITKYHFNDPAFPVTDIQATGIAELGTESMTLIKGNVYFDVVEPAGSPEVPIVNPSINAYKQTTGGQINLNSYGSSIAQTLSGFTMVAEPGVYTIDAYAYVNGTRTRFNGTTITFSDPENTGIGSSVVTQITPAPDLRVSLTFDQVTAPGISTVVVTPLGPAVPEGYRIACGDGQTCDPRYYDISTTALWSGETTVCIRQQFTGVSAVQGATFQLHHYDTLLGTWENPLPPPNGGASSINCNESLSACGCTDAASCGIDSVHNVFLVCGVTNSFSPFAIFQPNVQRTPPQLSLPAQVLADATSTAGATVSYQVSATDDLDGPVPVTCSPASGGQFAIGTTTVTCSAQNSAGQVAQGSFPVIVSYVWSDVLSPLHPSGGNQLKAGRTVPVKFALTGASAGVSNLVALLYVAPIVGGVPGAEVPAKPAGNGPNNTQFRYDSTSQEYIFNWSTKGLATGLYQLRIELGDGKPHTIPVELN